MKGKLVLVARILLGLAFTVFGLNGFLEFLPPPEPTPEGENFIGAIIETGYEWPFLKGSETICGLLLLAGRFVPLALTVLAPIILNILAFDLFLDPAGLPVGIVVLVLEVFLAYSYRNSFKGVLNSSAQPG